MRIHLPRLTWICCLLFLAGQAMAVPADTLHLYPFIARLQAARTTIARIDTNAIPDPKPFFAVANELAHPVWLVYFNGNDSVRQFVSTEWALSYASDVFDLVYDPQIITPDMPIYSEDDEFGQDRNYRASEIDSMLRGTLPLPNYNPYMIDLSDILEVRRRMLLQIDGYIASILANPAFKYSGEGNADLDALRKQYDRYEKVPEEEEDTIDTPDVDLEPSAFEELLSALREILNLILILAMIVGIGFGIYKLNNYFDSRKSEEQPILLEDGGLLQKKDARTSEGLRQQAALAYSEQDFRECLRLEYVRFILRLHEHRVVIYKSSYTNWEYLERVQQINGPTDLLKEVTLRFDQAVYGEFPVARADADFFRELIDKCLVWADER